MPRLAKVGLPLVFLLLVLALPGPLHAVASQTWRQRGREDFEKGDPKGVALSADGAARLSPRVDTLFESPQPYVWALARDARGTVYAAGGNDGRIDRIASGGKASLFFRAADPEVHALAVDAGGNLYAGTAPGGRVYKISPEGKAIWTAETGEQYIWSLAFDRQGALYAGTGLEGRVLKFDANGAFRIFFDSAETHIRTLLPERDGGLIAGSDGHGLVLRLSPKGEGFVLYDAPLAEVAALAAGPRGTIYAAVVGEPGRPAVPRPSAPAPTPAPTPATPPAPQEGGPQPPAQPAQPAAPQEAAPAPQVEQRVPIAMEGKVLLLSPDGYAREIWSGTQEAILSLAALPDGDVLMGSSAEGRIHRLRADAEVEEAVHISSAHVTSLLPTGPAGDVLIGGSNFGTVSALRPGHRKSGTLESKILDAKGFATWGRLIERAELPKGTSIAIAARSGNTESPDRTWSDWMPVTGETDGGRIACPPARFLQWRATLATEDPARSPALREVGLTFMQRNLPPEIRKLEVQPGGVAFTEVAAGPGGGSPEGRSGGQAEIEGGVTRKPKPQSRKGYEPGARSLTWQGSDPNDDDLVYDVDYRAIDEKNWKRIRRAIATEFVTLDGASIPDGTYQFRVVASDAPSNPPGEPLTTEALSAFFDVDNTPPRVGTIQAATQPSKARLTFTVNDTFSIIRQVAYSVDAGDWVVVLPADGLNDSREEAYDLAIRDLSSGEHSIVVRATDAAGNVGAGRAVVQIP